MAATIQIKRRIGQAGPPATLAAGEPAYNDPGGTDPNRHDLFIGNGTAVVTMVSSRRQVELTGEQTITGDKTIDVGHLRITGGAAGDVLKTTDPATGNLQWAEGTVNTNDSLSGNGNLATPLAVVCATGTEIATGTDNVKAICSAGLRTQTGEDVANLQTNEKTLVPAINELLEVIHDVEGGGALTVSVAPLTGAGTNASPLGVTPATGAQVTTGTDNVFPVTSARLRDQLGEDVGELNTTAETIVPAINELLATIEHGGQIAVTTAAPISGTGETATPLGVTPANPSQLTAGTDNVYPVTSAGLRSKLGADVASLETDAKQVVPAINELLSTIEDGGQIAVTVALPISGNGTTASPLGVTSASNTQIDAGTDTTYPVNSAGLRHVTGDAATLETTATTLVPAINELLATIQHGGQIAITTQAPVNGVGTTASPLGVTSANNSQIDAGTDTTYPVNSAGLRHVTGDTATLNTTATAIVPAINEILATIAAGGAVATAAPISGAGSTASPLTVTPASAAYIATGTDDVYPVTSAGLRGEMGLSASGLLTEVKTVVPAINELHGRTVALASAVRFVGTYNAATNVVTPSVGSPIAAPGPLPAATTDNQGWVVLVDTAGTGTGNAPNVGLSVGDWLISTGAAWLHLDLDVPATAASNVSVTTVPGITATNVQQVLEILATTTLTMVEVDGVSIVGDGVAPASALSVNIVDGGEYGA